MARPPTQITNRQCLKVWYYKLHTQEHILHIQRFAQNLLIFNKTISNPALSVQRSRFSSIQRSHGFLALPYRLIKEIHHNFRYPRNKSIKADSQERPHRNEISNKLVLAVHIR